MYECKSFVSSYHIFKGIQLLKVGVDAIVSTEQRFTYGQRVLYYKGSVRHVGVVAGYEDRDAGAIIKQPRILVKGAGMVTPVAESRLSHYRQSWHTSVMPRPKRATLVLKLFFSHRRVLSGGHLAATAETKSTKCSPTAPSNDTEKEACHAKFSSPFVESRCAAWDEELRRVNEELNASTRMVDMEVMKSHLDDMAFLGTCNNFLGVVFGTGRHAVCAQAPYSLKPSVKAIASKHKERMIKKQKQMRRYFKRMQRRAVQLEKKFENHCLPDALRAVGLRVKCDRNGPFNVLEDGSKMLKPLGKIIKAVSRIRSTGPGRWIVCRSAHCFSVRRKGEGNTHSFDGADKKRVAATDLDTLMEDTKIFEVPRRHS